MVWIISILAGYCAVKWFVAELAGSTASIIMERRGIYPSDDEVRDAGRMALKRMFSRQK